VNYPPGNQSLLFSVKEVKDDFAFAHIGDILEEMGANPQQKFGHYRIGEKIHLILRSEHDVFKVLCHYDSIPHKKFNYNKKTEKVLTVLNQVFSNYVEFYNLKVKKPGIERSRPARQCLQVKPIKQKEKAKAHRPKPSTNNPHATTIFLDKIAREIQSHVQLLPESCKKYMDKEKLAQYFEDVYRHKLQRENRSKKDIQSTLGVATIAIDQWIDANFQPFSEQLWKIFRRKEKRLIHSKKYYLSKVIAICSKGYSSQRNTTPIFSATCKGLDLDRPEILNLLGRLDRADSLEEYTSLSLKFRFALNRLLKHAGLGSWGEDVGLGDQILLRLVEITRARLPEVRIAKLVRRFCFLNEQFRSRVVSRLPFFCQGEGSKSYSPLIDSLISLFDLTELDLVRSQIELLVAGKIAISEFRAILKYIVKRVTALETLNQMIIILNQVPRIRSKKKKRKKAKKAKKEQAPSQPKVRETPVEAGVQEKKQVFSQKDLSITYYLLLDSIKRHFGRSVFSLP